MPGGIVSVALSLGLPPVAVSDCRCSTLPGLSSRETIASPATIRQTDTDIIARPPRQPVTAELTGSPTSGCHDG